MTKKPATKKAVVRTARRQRIATGILAGKSVVDIAQHEGISRTYASGEAHSEETLALISTMVDGCRPRVLRLLDKVFTTIEDSLGAMRSVVCDKAIADAGPDHFARLAGAKRFIELVSAGRVLAKPEDKNKPHGPITMQMIEAAIAAERSGGMQ